MASRDARSVSPATDMTRTVSYTVTLKRTEDDRWKAWCRTLPECRGEGKNKKRAYMAIKKEIRSHLRKRLRQGGPVPIDRTTTKFYRVDLDSLRGIEELR